MMESLSLEEENIITDTRNLFRLKKSQIMLQLKIFRRYLKNIINNLKKSDTWKIQVTIANNFIYSINNDEEHVMHSKSDNIEIMINDEADEVKKEFFDSVKNRY